MIDNVKVKEMSMPEEWSEAVGHRIDLLGAIIRVTQALNFAPWGR